MDVRNVMPYGRFSCISASLLAWGLSLLPAAPPRSFSFSVQWLVGSLLL